VTERRQTEINFGGFLQSFSGGACFALSFRSGQIDNVQFASLDLYFTLIVDLRAFHCDCEDRVRSGRVFVHIRLADMAIQVSLLENLHHVVWGLNDEGRQVFDIDTSVLVFELKALSTTFLVEQILNLFIVDLEVGSAHKVLLLAVTLDLLEYVLEGAWQNSFFGFVLQDSCDRESLASTCLTVGENRSVVSLDNVLAHWVRSLSKDVRLF
jgi:hypothetical protein